MMWIVKIYRDYEITHVLTTHIDSLIVNSGNCLFICMVSGSLIVGDLKYTPCIHLIYLTRSIDCVCVYALTPFVYRNEHIRNHRSAFIGMML